MFFHQEKNPLVLYGTLIVTNREMRHRASSSKHLHVTYCTKETLDMHDHINKEPLKYPYITAHKRQDTFPNLEHPLLVHETYFHLFAFLRSLVTFTYITHKDLTS